MYVEVTDSVSGMENMMEPPRQTADDNGEKIPVDPDQPVELLQHSLAGLTRVGSTFDMPHECNGITMYVHT
jgi:hypothetical protein